MNQQGQGSGSSNPPPNVPAKRKRGRPRKSETAAPAAVMPLRVFPGNVIIHTQTEGPSSRPGDEMLGKAVNGVISGQFGAGYLLNVQIEGSQDSLNGMAFLPGQFTPVTPENDVAPHLPMLQRKEFPIPSSGQSSKQFKVPKPVVRQSKVQVLPSQIYSGASVSAPMANMPRIDTPISTGGIPQVLSDPGQASQSALPEASRQVKESEQTSEAMNIDKELQTGKQADVQMQDEPNISNVELQQMPGSAELETVQSEQIHDEPKNSDKEDSPKPAFESRLPLTSLTGEAGPSGTKSISEGCSLPETRDPQNRSPSGETPMEQDIQPNQSLFK